MSIFQIISILICLVAVGGYINFRFWKFPATIGHIIFALAVSMFINILHAAGFIETNVIKSLIGQINFPDVLLHGMLAFLLFAGALHINLDDLKKVKWSVSVLATFGVVFSTFLIGSCIWYAANLVGLGMPYIYALLFGALIAPTDPIAVLAMLKEAGVSKKMYVKIGGESLFNDGVAVVVFLTILGVTTGAAAANPASIAMLLGQEVLGGLMLGGILGWAAAWLMRSIEDYKVEVLITLALAMGGYALAELIHVSAPIGIVTAGLIVGNKSRKKSVMREEERKRLDDFWELIDEILNAVLFLLIGLLVVTLSFDSRYVILGISAIFVTLLARWLSVLLSVAIVGIRRKSSRGTVGLLTWGGLRGGLSVAMALSLPDSPEKALIIPVTYIVVLFSLLVQGMTFKRSIGFFIKGKIA